MSKAGGVVLCGGRSSRMGRPKAWLSVDGETMLHRVVRVVAAVADPVVVVAAAGQDVPPLPVGVEVVRDEADGGGPLGGLAAGLASLAGRAEVVYLSGCDVPLLRPAFVRRVLAPLSPAGRGAGGEGVLIA
ncbi:MAG: NTP transferase domain-containing protein, partial [Gemmataceae bacterium]